MSKEYDALTALQNFLVAEMDATPEDALTLENILIDYPEPDKAKHDVMLYIVPDAGSWNQLTTESLEESLNVKMYLTVRQSTTHKTMTEIIQAAYDYFAAMINAINTDQSIGGSFLSAELMQYDFYPAISGMNLVAGIETDIVLKFERTPNLLPGDTLPGEYVFPGGD